MAGDDFNKAIKYIIIKIKKALKEQPLSANKFSSIESYLSGLGIN